MTAATPGQAAHRADGLSKGLSEESIRRNWEGAHFKYQQLWEDIAQAAIAITAVLPENVKQALIDAATEDGLRPCSYTLADVGRFLEAEAAAQDARPAPCDLPVTTPAVTRPSYGDVIVLAVGEDFAAERAQELQNMLAALNQGVTVTTVRGVDALRAWQPPDTAPKPAPELATLLADWRKTADSLKHRGGVGNARERNTLEVVIGQVEAILTRPTEPAPELAAHREFTGEILGELRQALGADPDSDAEPGEAPEAHAIRLVHYLKERIDELHGLIAEGEPLSVKPSDDVKPAPELAAAVRVAETVLDLLDDFTHAVIDYRGTSPAITAAAVSVRRKAGLPPVEGK